jgi:ubiquinone/menaquinone biosynthesis C-methylase UbiE
MPSITDQDHLVTRQYKDPANLTARGSLHERFSTNPTGWFRWVFDQLAELPEQCSLLELGCGPAWVWAHNRSRIPPGWQLLLTDLSQGMVDQARRNLGPGADPRFRFDIVDAQAIPCADASFDAVMANHMLYHVPDRPRAFSEIRRVLKPGGRLFAATNGQGHMTEIWEMVLQVTDRSLDANRSELHFGLDNGIEQLAPYFSHVERRDYLDSLLVTEVEPLIAYATSSELWGIQGDDDATRRLAAFIQRRLAAAGAIRIRKNSGLFLAQK